MRAVTIAFAIVALLMTGTPATQDVDTFKVPAFGQIVVYRPSSAPAQVVLFVSGDGGWNLGVVSMAGRLRDLGAIVAGIDIRAFLQSLDTSKGCAYPAGALEELSRAIQLRYKLPGYKRPILVGYSSGATLVSVLFIAFAVGMGVGIVELAGRRPRPGVSSRASPGSKVSSTFSNALRPRSSAIHGLSEQPRRGRWRSFCSMRRRCGSAFVRSEVVRPRMRSSPVS